MALKSNAEREAEEFNEKVKNIIKRKDDLICQVESDVHKPNVISPSTVGRRDAWVEVTFYNVRDVESVFTPQEMLRFGEMGADVQFYNHVHEPSVEISNQFD